MSRRSSLLEVVGGLIERTYAMRSGLVELAPFVIGDRGFHRFYAARAGFAETGSAAGDGARTLVRETDEGVRASIYLPDALIR